MDAFYASVELLRYPQLKGLPVVIGGGRRRLDDLPCARTTRTCPCMKSPWRPFRCCKDYTGRGVITTATYAARQFGVGSAMGMMKAAGCARRPLCCRWILTRYRRFSRRSKHHHRDRAGDGRPRRGRGLHRLHRCARRPARGRAGAGAADPEKHLRRHRPDLLIGVAPNKLLAKMASEFNKPNGISIVYETTCRP
jgi:DNA polymerase-4